MKIKIKTISAIAFATFLLLATIETFVGTPDISAKNENISSENTLEVPLLGTSENQKNTKYETLIEISILALTAVSFLILNTNLGKNTRQKS